MDIMKLNEIKDEEERSGLKASFKGKWSRRKIKSINKKSETMRLSEEQIF